MYQEFARVYDEFMEVIPYSEWADYIEEIWKKHQMQPDLVLDLACGTGGLALELSKRGYDLIGSDVSVDMLEAAQEKAMEQQQDILLLHQDMRELALYSPVSSILCTCDSLNYILELRDLQTVFHLVNQYLEPGGLFIFDINTKYKYKEILADHVYADTYDDAAFIWQNQYDEAACLNDYMVTFFIEEADGRYQKYEELHTQRGYEVEEIVQCIETADMRVEALYDGFTLQPPKAESERICFVVRTQRKGRVQ